MRPIRLEVFELEPRLAGPVAAALADLPVAVQRWDGRRRDDPWQIATGRRLLLVDLTIDPLAALGFLERCHRWGRPASVAAVAPPGQDRLAALARDLGASSILVEPVAVHALANRMRNSILFLTDTMRRSPAGAGVAR